MQDEITVRQNAAEAKAKAQAEEKANAEYEQEQEQQRKKARLLVTPAVTSPIVSVSNDALLDRDDSLDWDTTLKMLDTTSDEIFQYGSLFNQDDDTNTFTNVLDDCTITDSNIFQAFHAE